jgi:hypothetical protein
VREIFRVMPDGNRIQITNFRLSDTYGLGARRRGILLMASADPIGKNPFRNCQLFRASPLGESLRQLTHFDTGATSVEGCQIGGRAGCGIDTVTHNPNVPGSRSFVFYSDCDPFGTNIDGTQVYAIDWDGTPLRQLTHTAGARYLPDGSLEVEFPGPTAIGGR